jgi:hypothetical protein
MEWRIGGFLLRASNRVPMDTEGPRHIDQGLALGQPFESLARLDITRESLGLSSCRATRDCERRIIDKIVGRHARSRPQNPRAAPPTVVQLLQLSNGAGSASGLLPAQ